VAIGRKALKAADGGDEMTRDSLPPGRPGAGKSRIQRARRVFGGLAGRVPDPAEARRLEAELNDAWLRLQFALVAGDPRLAQAERQAYAQVLEEARRSAREGRAAPEGQGTIL
jgi:hypothetical protein